MQTSKYYAVKTLLENNINELPCTDFTISKIIENYGFEIIPYNYPIGSAENEEFKALGILSIAENYKMFTYNSSTYKLVFYRSSLSTEDRTRMLAHELGHMILGHIASRGVRCSSDFENKSPQEQEANEFALELLAPSCILGKKIGITPQKISHLTLLDTHCSKIAYISAKEHKFYTSDERRLYNMFNTVKHKRLKILLIVLLIMLLSILSVIIIFINKNTSTTAFNASTN